MNGKPGDSSLTDIVIHGLGVYSPEIDALILDAHEAGAFHNPLAQFFLLFFDQSFREIERSDADRMTKERMRDGQLSEMRRTLLSFTESLDGHDGAEA